MPYLKSFCLVFPFSSIKTGQPTFGRDFEINRQTFQRLDFCNPKVRPISSCHSRKKKRTGGGKGEVGLVRSRGKCTVVVIKNAQVVYSPHRQTKEWGVTWRGKLICHMGSKLGRGRGLDLADCCVSDDGSTGRLWQPSITRKCANCNRKTISIVKFVQTNEAKKMLK